MLFLVGGEQIIPRGLVLRAALNVRGPVLGGLFGNVEEFVGRPAQRFFGLLHVFRAHGLAMDFIGAGPGAAIADNRPHGDDRRLVLHRLGILDRFRDRIQIVAVGSPLDMPVIALEALLYVLGERELGGAVERDK